MEPHLPFLVFTLIVLSRVWLISANEKCVRGAGSDIKCYECSTKRDANCADPFNFTAHPKYLPPVSQCMGCCVKIVQQVGPDSEIITRTCTKKLKIKLFLVDHVCMTQGNGRGKICFCEEDQCNAQIRQQIPYFLILITLVIFLCITFH